MKTKIVYVVISGENDIYFEQAWVSAWSLKYYNPSAHIVFISDTDTLNLIELSGRKNGLSLFDEVIIKSFECNVKNIERSRWLKTNIRSLVKGTFLFIDTDTVIAGNLDFVDSIDCDLGMVFDLHCPILKHPFENGIRKNIKRLFNVQITDNINYFNSGVIFARDTQNVNDFFIKWFKNWQDCNKKYGSVFDQPPLIKTDLDMGGVIKPIDGNLNCQILGSIEFLHTAKIIHFFNTTWAKTTMSPFFGKEIYLQIKKEENLSEEIRNKILNCKTSFSSPSIVILAEEDIKFYKSPSYRLLKSLYDNSILSFISDICSRFVLKLYRIFACKRGGGIK